MIKILFDHQIFSEQHYGGISRYFANLCKGVNEKNNAQVKVGVRYVKNYYLKFYPQSFNNFFGRWFLKKTNKRYRYNQKYSISLLKNNDHDIFHATYYDNYSLAFNKKPLVITIHDMIHENNPEMFADSEIIIAQKKNMMQAANAIIAISNFTLHEIVKFYPQFASKITVVYHGIATLQKTAVKDSTTPDQFILFVGERKNYKNFNVMIKALAPIFVKNKSLKLVCAGGKEFNIDELNLLSELEVLPQCQQINADDNLLNLLYQKALVFIYPSSQEGFGLPILEAFKNNCVIACSNQSCLPEIGADAVQYFDPNDGRSILNAVEELLNNPKLVNELQKKGTKRLKEFSLQKCIEHTLKVYGQVI